MQTSLIRQLWQGLRNGKCADVAVFDDLKHTSKSLNAYIYYEIPVSI